MMLWKCDICGKTEECVISIPHTEPATWVRLSQHNKYTRIVCSLECAQKMMIKEFFDKDKD